MSLVNDLLKFTSSDTQICWNFLLRDQNYIGMFSWTNLSCLSDDRFFREKAELISQAWTTKKYTFQVTVIVRHDWSTNNIHFNKERLGEAISSVSCVLVEKPLKCKLRFYVLLIVMQQLADSTCKPQHKKMDVHIYVPSKVWDQSITKTRLFKYIENFTTKNWKFSDKNSDIFHFSAQNIDCGYSLELPWQGSSNEYPQSMFLSKNEKNNVYPCKP